MRLLVFGGSQGSGRFGDEWLKSRLSETQSGGWRRDWWSGDFMHITESKSLALPDTGSPNSPLYLLSPFVSGISFGLGYAEIEQRSGA